MKINTRIRYGIRTMMEIAKHDHKNGVLQKDIAVNQEISEKYLDSIISSLKISGLIINLAGKKSGYILNKPQSSITIYDIYKAFEPELAIVQCIYNPNTCKRNKTCSTREYWTGLNNIIIDYYKNTTLEMLINRNIELNSISIDPCC